MKWLVTVLTLLGGILPASGIYQAWREFSARRNHLSSKIARVDRILADSNLSDEEKSRQLHQTAPPEGTWADVMYTRERLELEHLQQAVPNISVPAVLAGAGVACATAAGLLSAWSDI
ncbi:hypothetical protein ACFVAQ_11185 [Streptomyces sp. NPDC057651]|uniref:hypothetical protein n=1 Tax=Streptomyces sp. NPDC057651 TaxID=3346194 RepID=UPI0036B4F63C